MTQDNPTNFRPLPIVLMVLILAAVAFGGWWLKQQPPSPVINSAGVTTLPQSNTQTLEDTQLTLFVPNDNAMLEKQTVPATESTSASFTDLAKYAISLLLKKAPDVFPAGTQLLDVKTGDNGTAILNFNSKFNDSSFWHGSALTLMGTYSVVNTITAISADDFKAQQVQFQVEGKPLAVLGELDVQDPLKPDMQWVQTN